MDGVRPCPFCGAKLEIRKGWYPRDNSDAYVHPANECILANFSTSNGFSTEGKDVERWNKRFHTVKVKPIVDMYKHLIKGAGNRE